MKKVMFAGLSLLSLVVLMACGEEESKKTQAPEQSPKQQQQNACTTNCCWKRGSRLYLAINGWQRSQVIGL